MTAKAALFKKGDRVTVSGRGRTATWGHTTGTVTAVRYRSVFVQWDNLAMEDQMLAEELTKIPGEREETPAEA